MSITSLIVVKSFAMAKRILLKVGVEGEIVPSTLPKLKPEDIVFGMARN